MKQSADVIVLGGGVSGLAAAENLARAGLKVVLLEARGRFGGRVHTRRPRGWKRPVEVGAEFIHGGNPELWRWLKTARIPVRRLRERHWILREGMVSGVAHVDRAIRRVTSLIRPTKAGRLSFGAYFRRYPARVDADDWALARGFVEGFEAAPLDSFSARSIAGETFDDEHQFDVVGGYGRLVDALVLAARRAGASLRAHSPVRSIHWKKGAVTATTRGGRRFSGRAAIVALPLGVLQARSGPGAVRFRPDPGPARRALAGMGLGHVARMAFRFKAGFWRRLPKSLRGRGSHGFGFLHDPEGTVPVWWSHSREPVLVAWAGGPAAKALLELKPRARRAAALRSLADGLGLPVKAVDGAVADWTTHNWTNDPFSRGAYSFIAAGHDGSGAILRRPVKATLHFCGEATAEGAEVGTVHGALESGLRAAARVRETLGRTA